MPLRHCRVIPNAGLYMAKLTSRSAQNSRRHCKAGLRPILCVGETAAERQRAPLLQVIERQLAVALKLADNLPDLSAAVIAYEPVWAIGTGQNATPGQAQEVHQAIRAQLDRHTARLGRRSELFTAAV